MIGFDSHWTSFNTNRLNFIKIQREDRTGIVHWEYGGLQFIQKNKWGVTRIGVAISNCGHFCETARYDLINPDELRRGRSNCCKCRGSDHLGACFLCRYKG